MAAVAACTALMQLIATNGPRAIAAIQTTVLVPQTSPVTSPGGAAQQKASSLTAPGTSPLGPLPPLAALSAVTAPDVASPGSSAGRQTLMQVSGQVCYCYHL
jgi:hypothetical protein